MSCKIYHSSNICFIKDTAINPPPLDPECDLTRGCNSMGGELMLVESKHIKDIAKDASNGHEEDQSGADLDKHDAGM